MKVIVMQPQEVDVKILKVNAGVRYWDDGSVNGVTDDPNYPAMPFSKSGRWIINIDIDKGIIVDWPQGVKASVDYKVCDDGVYSLIDSKGNVIRHFANEYVPNVLCPEESGYGDYIIMNIDEYGRISGWDKERIQSML